jgi:hypothetical protein
MDHLPAALGALEDAFPVLAPTLSLPRAGCFRWPEKLARLASLKGGYLLGGEIAQQGIAERGKVRGFLYIDGRSGLSRKTHDPEGLCGARHLAQPQLPTMGQ